MFALPHWLRFEKLSVVGYFDRYWKLENQQCAMRFFQADSQQLRDDGDLGIVRFVDSATETVSILQENVFPLMNGLGSRTGASHAHRFASILQCMLFELIDSNLPEYDCVSSEAVVRSRWNKTMSVFLKTILQYVNLTALVLPTHDRYTETVAQCGGDVQRHAWLHSAPIAVQRCLDSDETASISEWIGGANRYPAHAAVEMRGVVTASAVWARRENAGSGQTFRFAPPATSL